MATLKLLLAAIPLFAATPAAATDVSDPTGDFLPSFTGPQSPDLDVTSFSVNFNPETELFILGATLAGDINPANDFYYVIGVNTGTGVIAPFGSIGEPNVIFNQVVVVAGEGEAFVGANDLDFSISGNAFQVNVPLSLLPSTGADPLTYSFNLWPRTDLTPSNLAAISDFAPENAMIHPTAVPEPLTWLSLLLGFGLVGTALRFRRARPMKQIA